MTRGGGKEELGKVMGPLFPRLHVSHAGKGGGPRAPPRNKMALYEQLTVPSNRFSSRASGASLVPSTSAAQILVSSTYQGPHHFLFVMTRMIYAGELWMHSGGEFL
ncbi:protein HEADING DATE 3B-like [Miscanthus floridulus]|uniref:protein HEADING DATE 3B-like n=1 Tax=Miscanthus floridulus TaxID=154761 RepID=UPI00345A0214